MQRIFCNYTSGNIMNHIYRIVRNAATGGRAIASELAKGWGKTSKSKVVAVTAALFGGLAATGSAYAGAGFTACEADQPTSSGSGWHGGATSMQAYNMGCASEPANVAFMGGTTGVDDNVYASPTSTYISVNSSTTTSSAYTGSVAGQSISMYAPNLFTVQAQTINLDAGSGGIDAGNSQLHSLAAGAVSASSTDAVNGSQLFATNSNMSNLQTTVNNISNGTAGLVQQASTGANLTVGAATDGGAVDFTGTAGARQLKGVSNGTADTDTVNVSQLKGVTTALGGGATIDQTTGAVTAPTYTVTNSDGTTSTVNTVGDAVSNLDGRVTTNTNDIATLNTNVSNITNQLNNGEVGLVQQDSTTGNITVAKDLNGSSVDFTNA